MRLLVRDFGHGSVSAVRLWSHESILFVITPAARVIWTVHGGAFAWRCRNIPVMIPMFGPPGTIHIGLPNYRQTPFSPATMGSKSPNLFVDCRFVLVASVPLDIFFSLGRDTPHSKR